MKTIRANFTERIFGDGLFTRYPGADFDPRKTKMDLVRDLNMSGTDTHDYVTNLHMVGTPTLEQMSSTLANQMTDQEYGVGLHQFSLHFTKKI